MYTAEITFEVAPAHDAETVTEMLERWLAALRLNGQLCGREYPIAVNQHRYFSFVMIPAADALDATHDGLYPQQLRKSLTDLTSSSISVRILGKDPSGASACSCGQEKSNILYTNNLSLESPLRCGVCFDPVPLYRIPPTTDNEYHDIVSWKSDYVACDQLQMNCMVLEQLATHELVNPRSDLSQQGRDICSRIMQSTGIPTYYFQYSDVSQEQSTTPGATCPACDKIWRLDEPHEEWFDYRCDRCYLVAGLV